MGDDAVKSGSTDGDKRGFCIYCMDRVWPGQRCPKCGRLNSEYTEQINHLPPGLVLYGRYLLGRVLGEGGFGITYIGFDLKLEMKVAIKEYFPSDLVARCAADSLDVSVRIGPAQQEYEKGLRRFLQEARTLARMVKQPQIVMVHDFFEANGTAYIVMEYVEGTTFASLVRQSGPIPPEKLFPLIEPLFSALSAVHAAGLIHRDISPDNLMLENGDVRLLDFGCARRSAAGGTETMTVALKHGYAPVEQYQVKGQGPWTDVYALSATIYFCLTGRVPPQSLSRTLEDTLIPPRKLGVNISQGQEEALLRGMAVNPSRRWQSVEELRRGLYDGSRSVPRPERRDAKKKRAATAIAALAAAAAVVVAALAFINPGGSRPTEPVAQAEMPPVSAPIETEQVESTASRSEVASVGGLIFSIQNGEATLVECGDSGAVLSVPGEVEGVPVTAIASGAFDGCGALTELTLPEGLLEIEDYAFSGCSELRLIHARCEGALYIAPAAFDGCASLTAIQAQNSAISWNAPGHCRVYVTGDDTGRGALERLSLGESGEVFALSSEGEAVLMYLPPAIRDYTVPEETDIGGRSVPVTYIHTDTMDEDAPPDSIAFAQKTLCSLEFAERIQDWDVRFLYIPSSYSHCWLFSCFLCLKLNNYCDGEPFLPSEELIDLAREDAEVLNAGYSAAPYEQGAQLEAWHVAEAAGYADARSCGYAGTLQVIYDLSRSEFEPILKFAERSDVHIGLGMYRNAEANAAYSVMYSAEA